MQPPKKKVPPDPVMVHVKGFNLEEIGEECLRLHLEKFSNVAVKDVQFGSKDNALVVFDREPGRKAFVLECSCVPQDCALLMKEKNLKEHYFYSFNLPGQEALK